MKSPSDCLTDQRFVFPGFFRSPFLSITYWLPIFAYCISEAVPFLGTEVSLEDLPFAFLWRSMSCLPLPCEAYTVRP